MFKNKKDIFFWILLISLIVLAIFINFNNEDFFEMNIYQIVSLSLVVVVSYYFTQKRLDSRRKRDVLNDLIKGIIESSIKLDRDKIQSENAKLFIMELRNMQNKISLVSKVSKEYKINNEIDYIKREVETIDGLVSNHIGDKDTLLKIFVDIEKNIKNIQNKCEDMQFKLYFD